MSLIKGFLGTASEVSQREIEQEIVPFLIQGERVERGYKLVRDLLVFTNKRLIIVDKQGITGKRTSYLSLPYKNITRFAVQTAGNIDINSELFVYMVGDPTPIMKNFSTEININDLQILLAHYILD